MHIHLCVFALIVSVFTGVVAAQTRPGPTDMKGMMQSPSLSTLSERAFRDAVEKFPKEKLKEEDISITVIDMRDPAKMQFGDFKGEVGKYPASVVKLFYMTAAQHEMEEKRLADSEELRRGLRDMIVDSNNDATNYILDCATGTSGGSELPPEEMKAWLEKRQGVNRYFASLGYHGINASQKTWCSGPYGRERVAQGPKYENRNSLTTNACARLMSEIVQGKAVNADRSKQMMELLHRDMTTKSAGPDDQAHGFSAMALSPTDRLWSKAGWTSTARHDVAYIENDQGVKMVIAVFTTGHARERQLLPAIVKTVIEGMTKS